MRAAHKTVFLVFLLTLALTKTPASAATLITDLSRDRIEITTSFTGTRVLLFGTKEGAGDLVIVVRGPNRREMIRRKEKSAGIWVNGTSVSFEAVPGYYFQASTRPLSQIAREEVLNKYRIGSMRLPLKAAAGTSPALAKEYRSALLRLKHDQGLYTVPSFPIKIIGDRLFRAELVFPSNVPTGTYTAEIYFFQNGRAANISRKTLAVTRAGVEATIFEFAHQHAAIYGISAIVVALLAGWLAGVIFKKV